MSGKYPIIFRQSGVDRVGAIHELPLLRLPSCLIPLLGGAGVGSGLLLLVNTTNFDALGSDIFSGNLLPTSSTSDRLLS